MCSCRDVQAGTTTRVSVAANGTQSNNLSGTSDISADGRYVAFDSDGSNLVPGDTNNVSDVFVRDMQTGTIMRASVASSGTQSGGAVPSMSDDGGRVVFTSEAALVAGDTNGDPDVFIRDLPAGTTIRASVKNNGSQGNDFGTDFNSFSLQGAISGDGWHVAFYSNNNSFVAGDTNAGADVFVRDLVASTTTRVSVRSDGSQTTAGNSLFGKASLSFDGRYVTFDILANDLFPGDSGGGDVVLHDRATAVTTQVSTTSTGGAGNGSSMRPEISTNGRFIAFESESSNLIPSDTNNGADIFVRDLQPVVADPPAAPTVTITDPITVANAGAATVSGDGEDGTTANISVDDTNPATPPVNTTAPVDPSGYTATVDVSGLDDGIVTATVTLTNAAELTSEPATATALKDTVAPGGPTVSITDPLTRRNLITPLSAQRVVVSGAGEAGATAHVSVDDLDARTSPVLAVVPVSTDARYSATMNLSSLSGGWLTATVHLTDAHGNAGVADNARALNLALPLFVW